MQETNERAPEQQRLSEEQIVKCVLKMLAYQSKNLLAKLSIFKVEIDQSYQLSSPTNPVDSSSELSPLSNVVLIAWYAHAGSGILLWPIGP